MRTARDDVAPLSRARLLAGLAFAGLLGCAHQPTPPAPPPASPRAAPAPSVPGASPAPSGSATPGAAPQATAAESPPARSTAGTPARAAPPKRPPSTAAPAAPAPGAAPASTARPAPPPLDLTSLEQRLRDTRAIGLFTKLSLKNQVDDLLGQFRAFYAGQGALTLAELRRSYELLFLKVVTVLQDGDPALAGAVSSSRDAIWAILSDRNRFNNL